MSKLVQASVEHRSDVLAQILHPEALEVLESASAEFEPEKAEPVPMPTPQTEEFRCYHVPDEFMKVYKSLSRATEMMKNSWKKTLKNNPSYFTDPEKQKVLRFAMQRPANYLTEIETYLENYHLLLKEQFHLQPLIHYISYLHVSLVQQLLVLYQCSLTVH